MPGYRLQVKSKGQSPHPAAMEGQEWGGYPLFLLTESLSKTPAGPGHISGSGENQKAGWYAQTSPNLW